MYMRSGRLVRKRKWNPGPSEEERKRIALENEKKVDIFGELPNELKCLVLSFMRASNEEKIAMGRVCKRWRAFFMALFYRERQKIRVDPGQWIDYTSNKELERFDIAFSGENFIFPPEFVHLLIHNPSAKYVWPISGVAEFYCNDLGKAETFELNGVKTVFIETAPPKKNIMYEEPHQCRAVEISGELSKTEKLIMYNVALENKEVFSSLSSLETLALTGWTDVDLDILPGTVEKVLLFRCRFEKPPSSTRAFSKMFLVDCTFSNSWFSDSCRDGLFGNCDYCLDYGGAWRGYSSIFARFRRKGMHGFETATSVYSAMEKEENLHDDFLCSYSFIHDLSSLSGLPVYNMYDIYLGEDPESVSF